MIPNKRIIIFKPTINKTFKKEKDKDQIVNKKNYSSATNKYNTKIVKTKKTKMIRLYKTKIVNLKKTKIVNMKKTKIIKPNLK